METTRAGGAETCEGCRCHLCRPLTLPQIPSLRPPVETLHHLGPLLTPRHGGLLGKASGLGCVNLSPDGVMVSPATSIFTRESSYVTELESDRSEVREGVGLSRREGSANGPGSHAHGGVKLLCRWRATGLWPPPPPSFGEGGFRPLSVPRALAAHACTVLRRAVPGPRRCPCSPGRRGKQDFCGELGRWPQQVVREETPSRGDW